jgi:LacI family transcriptional regulator
VRAGVRVPDEIAIVGYDDIDFAAAAAVPLTSVRQPRQLIGRTAAELVIAETMSPGEHRHQHVLFAPELVVRESSRRVQRVRRRTK